MQEAAVVERDSVAQGPCVVVGPRRLAGEVDEILQKLLRLVQLHPGNAVGKATDQQ